MLPLYKKTAYAKGSTATKLQIIGVVQKILDASSNFHAPYHICYFAAKAKILDASSIFVC